MFTIWYTAFAWNEYRETILRRLQQLRGIAPTNNAQTTEPSVPETLNLPPETKPTSPIVAPATVKPNVTPPVPSKPQPIPQTPPTRPIKQLSPSPPPPVAPPKKKPSSFAFEKKLSSESSESDSSPSPILRGKNDAFNMKKSSPKFKNSDVVDFLSKEIDASFPQPNPPKQKSPPKKIDTKLSKSKRNNMVSAEVLEKLETEFKKLEASDSKSLLKKFLTREIFDQLKTKQTSFGSTLLDCIQSGLANHDSGVGIYAPDAEAYTVFADLFDPIIEDYHGGFKKTDKHPPKDFGDCDTLGNLDPAGEYVVSTRVRCGRSLQGYPFNPCLTEEQYKEMQDKVSATLSGLEGELKGTYYPLAGMTKEVQQKLIDDHFLFKEGDRFLQTANACRFWPTGRGIYHNENKTFLVWCNEEDHLRIISMQMGGDLGQVFRRLTTAVNDIEKRIPFSHDDRLGFLTFCPTNLGTTIRASVHIKVPKLAANKAKLDEIAGKFNLQVRGTRGEHTEAEGGIYDISNKRRMGLTEYQAVKEMYDGITELIKIEKEL